MSTYDEMLAEIASRHNIPTAGFAQPQIAAGSTYESMLAGIAQRSQPQQQPQLTNTVEPEQQEKIGFWENIQRGGWGGFFDKATLGVKPLFEAKSLYDTVNRFQADQYGSGFFADKDRDEDKQDITDYLEKQAEIQERGLTKGAKIGNIIGEMLPFMVEFIATGGVASLGKAAAKKGVLKMVARVTGKAVAGKAAKATASAAGVIASAATRVALLPHLSLTDFVKRRMPDIQISPEGQMIFEESKDSPFKSAYKAIGNQFIEMASEELGPTIGKVASKLLPKKAVMAFGRLKSDWVKTGLGRTAAKFNKKVLSPGGFNGILEEYGEERLGALMRVGAGIDEGEGSTFEKIQKGIWPGAEQAFVELIAFSVLPAGNVAAAAAFNAKPEKTTYSRRDIIKTYGIKANTSKGVRDALWEVDHPEPDKYTEESIAVRREWLLEELDKDQKTVNMEDAPAFEAKPKEDVEGGESVSNGIEESGVEIPETEITPETPIEAEVPLEQEVPVEAEIVPEPAAQEPETVKKPFSKGKQAQGEAGEVESVVEKATKKHLESMREAKKPESALSEIEKIRLVHRSRGITVPADVEAEMLSKEKELKEQGYEISNVGFVEGESVSEVLTEGATAKLEFISDDTLPEGEQVVDRITSAGVSKDGVLVKAPEVRIRIGTAKPKSKYAEGFEAAMERKAARDVETEVPAVTPERTAEITDIAQQLADQTGKSIYVKDGKVLVKKPEGEFTEVKPAQAQGEAGEVEELEEEKKVKILKKLQRQNSIKLDPTRTAQESMGVGVEKGPPDFIIGTKDATTDDILESVFHELGHFEPGIYEEFLEFGEDIGTELTANQVAIEDAYREGFIITPEMVIKGQPRLKEYAKYLKLPESKPAEPKFSKGKVFKESELEARLAKRAEIDAAEKKTELVVKQVRNVVSDKATPEQEKQIGSVVKENLTTETKPISKGKVAPKKTVEAKPAKATVTDKSVRDLGQQAIVTSDTIKVVSRVGRKKAGEYSFTRSEWDATAKHANPNYAKAKLIESKTKELDDQPGGADQAVRIRDSQISAIDKAISKLAETDDSSFGEKNETFSKDEFEKRKAKIAQAEPLGKGKPSKGMRKGAARLLTAEDLKDAAWFAGYYFEGGIREIGALTEKLVEIIGEPVRSHMQKLFAEAKKTVEANEATLTQEVKEKPEEKLYHGTSTPLPKTLGGYYGSVVNYYGSGFYTTSDSKIAKGYTRKGKGKQPTIYDVSQKEGVELYDMEQPIPEEHKKGLTEAFDDFGEIIDETNNLREAFDKMREEGTYEGLSALDIQEYFDSVGNYLESKGFQGLIHTGGLRTGKAPHTVKIFWNPADSVNVKKTVEAVEKSQIPSVQAETAPTKKAVSETKKADATPKVAPKASGKVKSTSTFVIESAKKLAEKGIDGDTDRETRQNKITSEAAKTFVNAMPEEAEKIALSGVDTTGLGAPIITAHYFNYLYENDRADEAASVLNTFAPELTERGQELSVLQEVTGQHTVLGATMKLANFRKQQAAERLPTDGKKKSPAKKTSDKVKSDVAKVKKAVDSKKMSRQEILDLIDKTECK